VEAGKQIQIFVLVVRHASYKCCIGVRHQSKECQSKDKNNLFRTLVQHVSYECHRSVRHRYTPNPRGVRAS